MATLTGRTWLWLVEHGGPLPGRVSLLLVGSITDGIWGSLQFVQLVFVWLGIVTSSL